MLVAPNKQRWSKKVYNTICTNCNCKQKSDQPRLIIIASYYEYNMKTVYLHKHTLLHSCQVLKVTIGKEPLQNMQLYIYLLNICMCWEMPNVSQHEQMQSLQEVGVRCKAATDAGTVSNRIYPSLKSVSCIQRNWCFNKLHDWWLFSLYGRNYSSFLCSNHFSLNLRWNPVCP